MKAAGSNARPLPRGAAMVAHTGQGACSWLAPPPHQPPYPLLGTSPLEACFTL